jgi:hypothetical protein
LRVLLSSSQSELTPAEVGELAAIASTIANGWHEWAGPDPDDALLVGFFSAHDGYRELFEKSFADALKYPRYQAVVTIGPKSDSAVDLDLTSGREYVTQPLTLLVENMINDGLFYRRAIEALEPALLEVMDSASPPIIFSNGGGVGEVAKIVEARRLKANRTGVPDRLIVLVDSDAKYPTHITATVNEVQKACAAHRAILIVLEKRSIENYLSNRHLDEYLKASFSTDLETNVNFIKSLSHTQRDHFPIKNGFKTVPVGHEASVYSDVPDDDLLSRKLSRAMTFFLENPIGRFDSEDLRSRFATQEFQTIIEQIRKAL